MNPHQHPYHQRPIVIQQTTSPGTKIGVWLLVLLISMPLLIMLVCCAFFPIIMAGAAGRPY
jgi:hypothetical protein